MIPRSFIEVVTLAALFGPSFVFIKVAVTEITPFTLVSLRVGLGALLLFSILALKKQRFLFPPSLWKQCFLLGFFVNGLPFVCFSYSLASIPSSLSALINGMTPVLTVILANQFLKDEKLTLTRMVGILISLLGFGVLFLPALFKTTQEIDFLGMSLSFVGAASYAVGAVYARKNMIKAPFLVVPCLQLATSLIYLLPLAFIFESPSCVFKASLTAIASLSGLAFFGTMLAFILYHRIVIKYGATTLSLVTYLLPIFGSLFGVIFLKERLTVDFCIATLLILLGLFVVNGMLVWPGRVPKMQN